MMSIPNGLAPHVIISMDGRTWIENLYSQNQEGVVFKHGLKTGTIKIIPQDKLETFVRSL